MLESIFGFVQGAFTFIIIAVVIMAIYFYGKSRYKIPAAGQALVVTGAKSGAKVYPGGGALVSPFRKHQFFPLNVMTVRSDDQETQSSTFVAIVVKWTAQLRADVTPEALENAVRGFSNYEPAAIENSLKQTLDGEVRAAIARMTPEEVVRDKDGFSKQVTEGVNIRMQELGFQLVSLNISDVFDNDNYYRNASAEDREAQRKRAERLTAEADREVAVARAEADQQSKAAQQKRDLALAEQQRELRLRQAAIQAETDKAEADASIAGEIQREVRKQELTARQGEVEVVQEQQRQAAAVARRDVELTDAETSRQRKVVEAQSAKEQAEIEAAAEARQAEIAAEAQANVATRFATGEAEAAVARAQGEADALTRRAEAEADRVRKTGLAKAEVDRAQGEAEASAIRARGEAEAEVQRKMAEALAANDGANLRVTLAEIQRDTTVKIYTTVGEAMARVGEHATFIDMGGSGAKDGDLLSGVLGNIPQLLKQLDVSSTALNGLPFGASLGSVVAGVTGGGQAPAGTDVVVASAPAADAGDSQPDDDAASDEIVLDDSSVADDDSDEGSSKA